MTNYVVVDTETTGLDIFLHQPYEVAWAGLEGPIDHGVLAHTLEHADPQALKIGHYWERGFDLYSKREAQETRHALRRDLLGATIIGANPGFDAAMLQRTLGVAVWNYHLIDVEVMAMSAFHWDTPKGLHAIAATLGIRWESGSDMHTAMGDVEVTRQAFLALRRCLAKSRRGLVLPEGASPDTVSPGPWLDISEVEVDGKRELEPGQPVN